ncbi:MAG: hypothetical protein ACRETD_01065, partial [Steroidobacteraceae bacterium]
MQANLHAWTLHTDQSQLITGYTTSNAGESFDNSSHADIPTKFNKTFVQASLEFGLTHEITLILEPSYVIADVRTLTAPPIHANNTSIEAGARFLLLGRSGKLALQATYKTAGAFDLSVSANHESGRQIEVRALRDELHSVRSERFLRYRSGRALHQSPAPQRNAIRYDGGTLGSAAYARDASKLQHHQRRWCPSAI